MWFYLIYVVSAALNVIGLRACKMCRTSRHNKNVVVVINSYETKILYLVVWNARVSTRYSVLARLSRNTSSIVRSNYNVDQVSELNSQLVAMDAKINSRRYLRW